MIELVREDADFFGCTAAIEHLRAILSEGTSADRQLAVYQKGLEDGLDPAEAMKEVVDWLIGETVGGMPQTHGSASGA